jgi:Domain of unknown function (DUF4865)
MIIKQYVITLPADYDMRIIRDRVATRGPSFDTLPGLGIKVFLIRERGRFGAVSNQYAPVYLWPSVEPIWNFVAGSGFAGIIDSFGRPPIHYWLGLAYARSDRRHSLADLASVTRETEAIAPGTDLADLRRREIAMAKDLVEDTPSLVARAVGLNPESWSLVRFDYWLLKQDDIIGQRYSYEVLHVSSPEADALNGAGQ